MKLVLQSLSSSGFKDVNKIIKIKHVQLVGELNITPIYVCNKI